MRSWNGVQDDKFKKSLGTRKKKVTKEDFRNQRNTLRSQTEFGNEKKKGYERGLS